MVRSPLQRPREQVQSLQIQVQLELHVSVCQLASGYCPRVLQVPKHLSLCLQVAVGLLAFVWVSAATIAALRTLGRNIKEVAGKAAITGGFWLCVLLVAYQIMQA